LYRYGTDELLTSATFDPTLGTTYVNIDIEDSKFLNDNLEFYIKVRFDQIVSWTNTQYYLQYKFYDGKYGIFNQKRYATYYYESKVNDNSDLMQMSNFDLIKSLPDITVLDFLKSFFKTFKINIYDVSIKDNKLYWLTPSDILDTSKSYGKRTLDYTEFLDLTKHTKENSNDYNRYNFKHFKSEYKSNIDYATAADGIEYGQLIYPEVEPTNPSTFEIETDFTIIPPRILSGTSDVQTMYGFTADTPEFTDTGASRYTPNYGECVLFYYHGQTSLNGQNMLFQTTNGNGVYTTTAFTKYNKVMPYSLSGGASLLWNDDYSNSLYEVYYKEMIARLLDPNVLKQTYYFNLPATELYLNESISEQGITSPTGYRLQNDIILMNDKFETIESEIDYTTGKAKLILLNY
jgi:hypothetical protein